MGAGKGEPGDAFHPSWAVIAMQAMFRPERASGVRETYEFRVDHEVFHARVENGQVEAVHGPAWEPTVTVTSDRDTFRTLASGEPSLEDAARTQTISVTGDRRALRRFERIFVRPMPARPGVAGSATAS